MSIAIHNQLFDATMTGDPLAAVAALEAGADPHILLDGRGVSVQNVIE